jgi:two-component system response regulator MprA
VGNGTQLKVGDLTLNSLTREVHRGERLLELTKTEFDLLELLMQQPGIVVTRETIYETIWGYNFETSSKSLDVYIGYLRRKTEEADESRMVFTVRGVGYTVKPS